MSPSFTKLRSLVAAAGLGLAALAVASAPAAAEKLLLGNEGVYPPFSIVDSDGNLTGFEPELAREVCKRMDVECEFVVMDFKALIPSILQGKFNVLTSQLSPTPERLKKLTYSEPIIYNPATFIVKKDSDYTFTPEGLKGKGLKIALQRGASSIPYIDKHFPDVFEKVLYDNPDQMRLDLMAGRIDLVFDSKLNWTFELIMKPEGKDWKIAGGDHWLGDEAVPQEKRGYSWAVRKGDEALIERFNVAIDQVITDCSFTKIREKFLSVPILAREQACLTN
ncbi:Histidine-binding periplasmic protein precursor [Hartmannibacter diazotrophicus]|uniref:Histidine-binding periplasmic protein n=1 Tax=Hartmannibacter diazotrophicus TaxID=1482074 RepID=A0A2C9D650_9HYPH|nr:transporter substrate-binding domain-containing protein [Hartmannibacter diazotrophicus]SON55670.1 Histidine-binding periplasmic protein precursor [Hartmannibacter diazotrophicus]